VKWLRWTALCFLAVTVAVATPGCPDPGPGTDGGRDGGPDGGENSGPYALSTLDAVPTPLLEDFTPQLVTAVGPGDRIGVAYFRADSGVQPDGGVETHYDINYLELQGGQVTRRERVQTVFNVNGLSLAFQSNGEPAVAYLGGPWRPNESIFWRNSDAVLSYRQPNGTWVEQIAVQMSGEAVSPNNAPSNNGYLVGLYPAVTFDGTRAYLAYRDAHFGQSIGPGDYNSSDLELAEGGPTAWSHIMLQEGGNNDQAWGGHTQILMAGGQPALIMDKVAFAATGIGRDVFFFRRQASAAWTTPIQVATTFDTTSGPSLAYDTGTRFGVAFSDRTQQALYFSESTNDGATWSQRDIAFQSGSGGWYPSLMFEPATGEPVIAFYVCSVRTGVTQVASCPEAEDALRVTERIGGQWYETTVDPAGGFQPRLMRLSSGRRLIVYRDPRNGTVKLAEER
jgi:hypothetical protein